LACLTLAAASLLAGCALLHPRKSFDQAIGHPPTLALQGSIAPGANADSVIPFDVVVVRDKAMLKQISQMDAATWFGAKGRCAYRGGAKAKVQFHSWEFVPGQSFALDVPLPADTRAVIGFADYDSAGEHRLLLPNSGSQFVEMGIDGIHASAGPSNSSPARPSAPEKQKVCPDD
jgi:hypothetical protein